MTQNKSSKVCGAVETAGEIADDHGSIFFSFIKDYHISQVNFDVSNALYQRTYFSNVPVTTYMTMF